jgi:hypothetical protein
MAAHSEIYMFAVKGPFLTLPKLLIKQYDLRTIKDINTEY